MGLMKSIVVLIPGLFDKPIKELQGSTPVEKAHCEVLDEISQRGQWIRVQPPKGGFEHSLLELFGLERGKTDLSVSSLEVYNKGHPFKPNQSSFLFQFISKYEDQVVSMDSTRLLREEELELFCKDLNETFGSWIHFIPLGGSKGVCIINESFEQRDSFCCPKDCEGKAYSDLLHPFFKQKRRVEKLDSIFDFLDCHPLNQVRRDFEERVANALFFYEKGAPLIAITSKKFYERFWLYSSVSSSRGLARLLSIKNLELPSQGFFGYLPLLIEEVKRAINVHHTLFLEFHEVLESTLAGKLLEKIKRMEYIDRHVLAPLYQLCNEEGIQLIVTPLKQTNIVEKKLEEGAVPWIIYNPKHKKSLESILSFREKELDRIQGTFTIRALASQFVYC